MAIALVLLAIAVVFNSLLWIVFLWVAFPFIKGLWLIKIKKGKKL